MTSINLIDLQNPCSVGETRYCFRKATLQDVLLLQNYKQATIFAHTGNLSVPEEQKILDYIDQHLPLDLAYIQMIVIDQKIVGCICVKPFRDGFLLDELYLEEAYRNQGIGSSILHSLQENSRGPLYLWVYRANDAAFRLYQRFHFEILEETPNRFLMTFTNSEKRGKII